MLKLLVGIVIDNYKIQNSVEKGEEFLSKEQRDYLLIKAYMLNYRPIIVVDPPRNIFRRCCFFIAES